MENIYLSIYSFGYSAGFIEDKRRSDDECLKPESLIDICNKYGLGGVEIPIDRYFPKYDLDGIVKLFKQFYTNDLGIKVDFENYSEKYIKKIIPIIKDFGNDFLRVKVSDFYGSNRYKHSQFNLHLEHFYQFLENILPILQKNNFKILVENHQDIILEDYYRIWERFPKELVRVNWDIGNSLPSLEDPNDFIINLHNDIGNIHLKDYKIYQTKKGYRLARCPLGQGVVDFKFIFSFLEKHHHTIPMSIELGAMVSRYSDIYEEQFWTSFPEVGNKKKKNFIEYIENNFNYFDSGETSWEIKKSPKDIQLSEMEDVQISIKFLKDLISGKI